MIALAVPSQEGRNVELIFVHGQTRVPRDGSHARGKPGLRRGAAASGKLCRNGGGRFFADHRRRSRPSALNSLLMRHRWTVLDVPVAESGGDDGDLDLVLDPVVD